MTYKLFEKISPNNNWSLINFTCNGKKLYPFSTIKDNGIENGFVVGVGKIISILFDGYKSGICINIDEDYPIKKVIKLYLLRIGEENNFHDFQFLYHTKCYNIKDKTPMKNICSSEFIKMIVIKC